MRVMANKCPVCFVPKRGGRRCSYHIDQRNRGLSDALVNASAASTIERNQVIQILCEAVDESRSRTEYHRAYYRANQDKRRKQRRESKQRRRVLSIHAHLIKQLCHAVDLGRQTAGW